MTKLSKNNSVKFPAELSWLSFNNSVLEEATDKSNPLYERIKFLAIHSSNLDEFGKIWRKEILKELEDNKIVYYESQDMESIHIKEVENYFKSKILSYIQLVYLYENSPQEYFLNNRQLYFFEYPFICLIL